MSDKGTSMYRGPQAEAWLVFLGKEEVVYGLNCVPSEFIHCNLNPGTSECGRIWT